MLDPDPVPLLELHCNCYRKKVSIFLGGGGDFQFQFLIQFQWGTLCSNVKGYCIRDSATDLALASIHLSVRGERCDMSMRTRTHARVHYESYVRQGWSSMCRCTYVYPPNKKEIYIYIKTQALTRFCLLCKARFVRKQEIYETPRSSLNSIKVP